MTAEVTTASTADVTADVSDAQVNAYFESEGKELPGDSGEVQESEAEESTNEIIADATPTKEKIAEPELSESEIKNYKSMAHEERERRKEIAQQVEQMKKENEQLKNTFQKIIAKAQEQQELEQKSREPNYEDDPLGSLKSENQKIKDQLADLQKFKEDQFNNYEVQTKQQQFINTYKAKVAEFAQTTPDFSDAYNHLIKSRIAEFEASGYSRDKINQMVHEDEAAIVATAFSQNANPGERIYNLAKLRGYQGKASNQNVQTNQQKIETLERGVKASKSINNAGTTSDERLTLESISDMDDADFDKFDWDKVLKMG